MQALAQISVSRKQSGGPAVLPCEMCRTLTENAMVFLLRSPPVWVGLAFDHMPLCIVWFRDMIEVCLARKQFGAATQLPALGGATGGDTTKALQDIQVWTHFPSWNKATIAPQNDCFLGPLHPCKD